MCAIGLVGADVVPGVRGSEGEAQVATQLSSCAAGYSDGGGMYYLTQANERTWIRDGVGLYAFPWPQR